MSKIRVVLVDDHTVVRQCIALAFGHEPDLEVVGEAGDGQEAVQLVGRLLPDVVVMDIAMPILNGFEATRQIIRGVSKVRVLVLSAYSDDEYVRQLTEVGASGYLLKQAPLTDLLRAVREVHLGNAFFSPAISRCLMVQCHRTISDVGRITPARTILTSREFEVLQLVAEGKTSKQIAAILGISVKTVEKHRNHLMEKLDIHDVAGLTRYAIAKGVIESYAPGRGP